MQTSQPETAPITPASKTPRPPRHGVDTPALMATIEAVRGKPELTAFRFRSSNRWINGTHSRSRIEPFSGAGGVHEHASSMEYDADHPTVLTGTDKGPAPVEFVLHALAACLTAGIANVAAARGVTLTAVESLIEGEIDLQGILGLSDQVRNGYQRIRASFTIKGDASPEKLREIVEQSRKRSAVFDIITGQVPVDIAVEVG